MTEQRITKKALISSAVSILLCISMLIGTTFAWFRSTATNTGNTVVIGDFGVDLLMYNESNEAYESIKDKTTGDIFNQTKDGMWEPGKTEIVFLKVANTGNLALKYNIRLNLTSEGLTDADVQSAFEYVILDKVKATDEAVAAIDSWDDVEGYTGGQTGAVPIGTVTAAENGKLLANDSRDGGDDEDYFALAVHMKEEVTDAKYMNQKIEFDVKVMATQAAVEEDSYGAEYDADATIVPMKDYVAAETTYGWNSAGSVTKNGIITLAFDTSSNTNQAATRRITTLIPGETYTFSALVKSTTGADPRIQVQNKNSSGAAYLIDKRLEEVVVNDEWQKVGFEIEVPESSEYVTILLYAKHPFDSSATQGEIQWKDVQILAPVEEETKTPDGSTD